MNNEKELRIIVAGSRDFKDYDLLCDTLMKFLSDMDDPNIVDNPSKVKFISGTARGADTLGEQFAYTYEYDVIRFPADWDRLGRKAGYIRNEEMAKYASEEGNTGALIAFWDGKSRGTMHMINLARQYGLIVRVIYYKGGYENG